MAGLDIDTLKKAAETRNADTPIGLYADDARIRVVNKATPPGSPRMIEGQAAITDYLRDVYGRDMTHAIGQEVIGPDRLSYTEACEYPDGTNVLSASVLELDDDGKILSHLIVETWDE